MMHNVAIGDIPHFKQIGNAMRPLLSPIKSNLSMTGAKNRSLPEPALVTAADIYLRPEPLHADLPAPTLLSDLCMAAEPDMLTGDDGAVSPAAKDGLVMPPPGAPPAI